ncbi:uncharacterized protein LOC144101985 isoform X1 [Amblyomma americanum]
MDSSGSEKKSFAESGMKISKNEATKWSALWQSAKQMVADVTKSLGGRGETCEEATKPLCEVFLVFSRSIGVPRAATCSAASSAESLQRSFMHWKVLIKFSNGQSCVYEAIQKNNVLTGRCELSRGLSSEDDKVTMVSLGEFDIPHSAIYEAFLSMDTDPEYHPVLNNCQTWVVNLLEKAGIRVPKELRTFAQQIQSLFSTGDKSKTFDFVAETVSIAVQRSGRKRSWWPNRTINGDT